jgi:hypothetical protein
LRSRFAWARYNRKSTKSSDCEKKIVTRKDLIDSLLNDVLLVFEKSSPLETLKKRQQYRDRG